MDFMIFDEAGNAVDSFESETAAMRSLLKMVAADPGAAEHLAILTFDDDGDAVGRPVTVSDARRQLAKSS